MFFVPPKISPTARIVFVADAFADEYVGGAELTTQALIDSSPYEVCRLHCRDVNMQTLEAGVNKHWIFGNFSTLNGALIPTIAANMKYSVLEYDYKYCRHRSPEKHLSIEGVPCDCHNQMNGKLVSAFYHAAQNIWWMSERQKDRYTTLFPFLADKPGIVLSSVFDDVTLGKIKLLRATRSAEDRTGWIVLGSNSWIKGFEDAEKWCKDNEKPYDVVWNVPYDTVLAKLASAEGLVYLPRGGDTCPRLVIEAKLLGCKLQLNDNVQHRNEEWFATDDLQEIEEYLYAARSVFWNATRSVIEHVHTISGYTTTLNCVDQQYPFKECIRSLAAFCDEVVVVDGGSTDGTREELEKLKAVIGDKLKVHVEPMNLSDVRFAVYDGQQKALARSLCTGEFCWQMDSDEIVHEDDAPKIRELLPKIPRQVDIMSLPVVEYWGKSGKVRIDVAPGKWRLSRNLPHITHGIPAQLRRYDDAGRLFAAKGTDGCDMIDARTGEPIPHVTFVTPTSEGLRTRALAGDPAALKEYEAWFNAVVLGVPGVFHYSWHDLERKIRLYRRYWTRHWCSLYNESQADTADSNMMFDKPWSDVTDADISDLAKRLDERLGGWVWHRKWDGVAATPSIACVRKEPTVMTGAQQ